MKNVTIYDTATFEVVSHGNGTAYSFTHKIKDETKFFQGDDAITFREEIEIRETVYPDMSLEVILGTVWFEYETGKET